MFYVCKMIGFVDWLDRGFDKHKRYALMLHMSFTQNINCFPQVNVTKSPSFHSTLDQRIKPAHAELVFYPRSAQQELLLVACLSCCVRLCMYMCVHESVLLLLLCVSVKSQKSGQLQLGMCVCTYACVYAHACAHVHKHTSLSLSLSLMYVCMCAGGRVCMCAYIMLLLLIV